MVEVTAQKNNTGRNEEDMVTSLSTVHIAIDEDKVGVCLMCLSRIEIMFC